MIATATADNKPPLDTETIAAQTGQESKSEPVTPERINSAIKWYRANIESIRAKLPIKLTGLTFGPKWIDSIERHIGLWESDKTSKHLAIAYIHTPLSKVRDELKNSS